MKKRMFWAGILAVTLLPRVAMALVIGDPAPAFDVKEWVKGGPVQIKPGTNTYVIEIWATWSPASIASFTNLNALQKQYKDKGVVFVGISDESQDTVKDFVLHGEGTNMQYAVAADNERKTASSYMTSFKRSQVPAVFIVGTNGNLLWHGEPFRALAPALARITSAGYDIDKDQKSGLAFDHMAQYLSLANRGDSRTKGAGRQLLDSRTNNVPLLCDMAFRISTAPGLKTRDFDLANEALTQAERLAPTNSPQVVVARGIWLFRSGKTNEGITAVRQVIATAPLPQDRTNAMRYLRTMEMDLARGVRNTPPPRKKPGSGAETQPVVPGVTPPQ